MLNTNSFSSDVQIDASSGIGIYKSNPLSHIVDYRDIILDPNTLDDLWIIWNDYKANRIYREEIKRVPVVVLQVVTVAGIKLAELVTKTDYNNQTFELKRNI